MVLEPAHALSFAVTIHPDKTPPTDFHVIPVSVSADYAQQTLVGRLSTLSQFAFIALFLLGLAISRKETSTLKVHAILLQSRS